MIRGLIYNAREQGRNLSLVIMIKQMRVGQSANL